MKWLSPNISNILSINPFKKEKPTASDPSVLNPQASSMLFNFYDKRSEMDSFLSEINDQKHFIKTTTSDRFTEHISKPIQEKVGIVGGTYAIVNHLDNRIWFLRNRSISDRHHKQFPFFEIPANGYFGDSRQEDNDLNAKLIDLMYEAENQTISLRVNKAYKAPFFLQNLPPHQSKYAFTPLPFEQKLREDKKINYTYCYTGEVVFHMYAWRWLLKYAQYAGFDSSIDLESPTIPNRRKADFNIWSLEAWEGFVDVPEKKWLKYLKGLEENKDVETKDRVNLYRQWKKVVNTYDRLQLGKDHDFYQQEWEHLGLGAQCPVKTDVELALLSYARHILKNTRSRKDIDEFLSSKHSFSSPKKKIVGSPNGLKRKILEINELIEQVIEEGDEAAKSKRIDKVCRAGKKEHQLYHYILRKIIYEALIENILKPREEICIRDLFREINRKSRFPIMASFFQTLLGADKMPVEHYFFPIGRSFQYPYKAELPIQSQNGDKVENNNVAIACIALKPIWALSRNANQKYYLTRNGNYYSDSPESKISDESFTRLRIIQDFLKHLSEPLVDFAFYGRVVEEQIEDKTKEKQFFFQAHEIRKLIESIRNSTPEFLLDEVRLYFNVIFGSRKYIIDSYYHGHQDLPEDYFLGNNYHELVDNASKIACRIQSIVELIGEEKLQSCTREDFEMRVNQKRKEIDNRISSDFSFTEILKENRKDEKATPFHFLSAVICGIRNALKHKQKGTAVNVQLSFDRQHLRIENKMKPISPLAKKDKGIKQHPGSTTASLNYYVSVYANIDKAILKPIENNIHLTSIPIPK